MTACQSRVERVCTHAATWKQEVRVGDRPDGRVLYFSYWCDEHAEIIAKRRKDEFIRPAFMTRIEDPTAVS